jgi:hypothetical protein
MPRGAPAEGCGLSTQSIGGSQATMQRPDHSLVPYPHFQPQPESLLPSTLKGWNIMSIGWGCGISILSSSSDLHRQDS